jgi:DNA invertase Pin-like site-specific DNA recombinase
VGFVSLGEGIDTATPAGRLQLHILGAIAEFERARIAERVRLGVSRARAQGKRLGRPKLKIDATRLAAVEGLTNSEAARQLGLSLSTFKRIRAGSKSCPRPA